MAGTKVDANAVLSEKDKVAYRFKRPVGSHPYLVGPLPIVDYARTLYLYVSLSLFEPGAQAFSHRASASPSKERFNQAHWNVMSVFGSISAILANYNEQRSSDGLLQTGAFQTCTVTVVNSQKTHKPCGFIFAQSYARHEHDDHDLVHVGDPTEAKRREDSRKAKRDPDIILHNQLHSGSDVIGDKIRGQTDSKSAKSRNGRAGGNKKEEKTFFQTMTRDQWFESASLYIVKHRRTDSRLLPVLHPHSDYNVFNVFRLSTCLEHARADNAEDAFWTGTNWESPKPIPPGGYAGDPDRALREFARPLRGSTTYLINGMELFPPQWFRTYFPHILGPQMNEALPEFIQLWQHYYVGTRDPDTNEPDPQSQEDIYFIEQAKQLARAFLHASGDGKEAGFTIERMIEDARRSYQIIVEEPYKRTGLVIDPAYAEREATRRADLWKKALPAGIDYDLVPDNDNEDEESEEDDMFGESKGERTQKTRKRTYIQVKLDEYTKIIKKSNKTDPYSADAGETIKVPLGGRVQPHPAMHDTFRDYRDQSKVRKEWAKEQFENMRAMFTASSLDLGLVERSYARYMAETLEKEGTFSMPFDLSFDGLTPFGNMMAATGIEQEYIQGTYWNHAAQLVMRIAVLSVGLEGPLKFNVYCHGPPSAGKSKMLDDTIALALPRTVNKSSGSSAQADLVEGASDIINLTVTVYHETPPELVMNTSKVSNGSGRGIDASNQANNRGATLWRDMLSEGTCEYQRFDKDADGKEIRHNIVIKAERGTIMLANADWSDLATNAQARLFALWIVFGVRRDIAFAHKASQVLNSDGIRLKERSIARFQRTQFFIWLITTLQKMKVLPAWTSLTSDSWVTRVLEKASERGLKDAMDSRSILKLKRVTTCMSYMDVLYRYLDGPDRLFHKEREWNWDKFLDIGTGLVVRVEHALCAMTLMCAEWHNPAISDVVYGISLYYGIGPDHSLGELGSSLAPDLVNAVRDRDAIVERERYEHHINQHRPMGQSRGGRRGRGGGSRGGRGGRGGTRGGSRTGGVLIGASSYSRSAYDRQRADGSEYAEAGASYEPTYDACARVATDAEVVATHGRACNTKEFYYFRVEEREAVTHEDRIKAWARKIDGSMKVKLAFGRLLEIIGKWANSYVNIPDPTYVGGGDGGGHMSKALEFEILPGTNQCQWLRLGKAFFKGQKETIILEAAAEVLSQNGFDMGKYQYITGIPNPDRFTFALFKRADAEEKKGRKPFLMFNSKANNPLAEEVLRDMFQLTNKAVNTTGVSLVQSRLASIINDAPWSCILDDETDAHEISREIHLAEMGFVDDEADPALFRNANHKFDHYQTRGRIYPDDVQYQMTIPERDLRMALHVPAIRDRHDVRIHAKQIRLLRGSKAALAEAGVSAPKEGKIVPLDRQPKWPRHLAPEEIFLRTQSRSALPDLSDHDLHRIQAQIDDEDKENVDPNSFMEPEPPSPRRAPPIPLRDRVPHPNPLSLSSSRAPPPVRARYANTDDDPASRHPTLAEYMAKHAASQLPQPPQSSSSTITTTTPKEFMPPGSFQFMNKRPLPESKTIPGGDESVPGPPKRRSLSQEWTSSSERAEWISRPDIGATGGGVPGMTRPTLNIRGIGAGIGVPAASLHRVVSTKSPASSPPLPTTITEEEQINPFDLALID